jgi:hypothetical protein
LAATFLLVRQTVTAQVLVATARNKLCIPIRQPTRGQDLNCAYDVPDIIMVTAGATSQQTESWQFQLVKLIKQPTTADMSTTFQKLNMRHRRLLWMNNQSATSVANKTNKNQSQSQGLQSQHCKDQGLSRQSKSRPKT